MDEEQPPHRNVEGSLQKNTAYCSANNSKSQSPAMVRGGGATKEKSANAPMKATYSNNRQNPAVTY